MKKVIENDLAYTQLENLVADRVASIDGPLFVVGTKLSAQKDLWELYLYNLPESNRQHYNCKACRRFIEKYGWLVTVNDDGEMCSVLWDDPGQAPSYFESAIDTMNSRVVLNCKITGVFYSSESIWGHPTTGDWTHLHGKFGAARADAFEAMAEKKQDYIQVKVALADYNEELAKKAVVLLSNDALARSEKKDSQARWFANLYKIRKNDSLLWKAIAEAPPGFCHIRAKMLGTLLDDLKNGVSVETIGRKWTAKMNSTQYMRPTTISEGSIEVAEKLVAELGVKESLKRRFARLEDVLNPIWQPKQEIFGEAIPGSVFGHLRGKAESEPMILPEKVMTWEKFQAEVIEKAKTIDYLATNQLTHFHALVTAQDYSSSCLFQWNNRLSWYVYNGGSLARDWNLMPGEWHKVNMIHKNPAQGLKEHENGIMICLENCKDLRYTTGGLFFPESLKNEYHPIRKVMERYSEEGVIAGKDEGNANGICVTKLCSHRLRVDLGDCVGLFHIDRLS